MKIVFSGDLGRPEAGLLRSPAVIETADELVLESTYGNRAHPDEPAEDVLARALGEALAAGGRLLIPAFAVGRAQEVLFSLRVLQASGRVPAVPIYLDSPLAREATALFAAYPDYLGPAVRAWLARPAPDRDRQAGPVHFVALRAETLELAKQEGPLVVIAGSGMATGGRVLNYLRAWRPDPRSVVLFPGYQARGTPGRMLVDGARTITIRGERLPVRARIRHSDAFSAHADAPAILRWLTRLHAAPRRVFLVHGEPRATGALARRIRTELGWQTCVPDFGQRIRFDIRAERSRP